MNDDIRLDINDQLFQVKLLVVDVDGVLTDGGLYYNDRGEVQRKFNVHDGLGLQLIMQAGIEVAIVSAKSSFSILARAKDLGIKHVLTGVGDKLTAMEELCQSMTIGLSQVAYVGDDLNDLAVMKAVICPFALANSMNENKAVAIYTTQKHGGNGAIREICDLLLKFKNLSR
ncbi:HAD family hydrolase [Nostoc sp. RF31YmG]|jgi:3-deoxy-D-manno-octulosonate 8-phosphate phosphatase (KDO 8-P phosphatase)|nr:HAD family hydrolase [Nostoc sp. RF31YmG]